VVVTTTRVAGTRQEQALEIFIASLEQAVAHTGRPVDAVLATLVYDAQYVAITALEAVLHDDLRVSLLFLESLKSKGMT